MDRHRKPELITEEPPLLKRETIQRGSFTITRITSEPETRIMKVANAVYLNANRTKAVPAGHEDAAFLFIGRNGTVKDEDAKKYGITEQGAKDQGKDESGGVIFKSGVTAATPDGVNTAPDAPQAIPLSGRMGLEADAKNVPLRKTVEPESAPTTGKAKRG